MGEDSSGPSSWWKTLPAIITGLVTALAGLIGAVALLIQNASGLATTWHNVFKSSPATVAASSPATPPSTTTPVTTNAAPSTTTTTATTVPATTAAAPVTPTATPSPPVPQTAPPLAPPLTQPDVPQTVSVAPATTQVTTTQPTTVQPTVPQTTNTETATVTPRHCATTEAAIQKPVIGLRDAWKQLDLELYMAQWATDATQVIKNKTRGLNEIRTQRQNLFPQLDTVTFEKFSPSPSSDLGVDGTGRAMRRVDNSYAMTFNFKNHKKSIEVEREFYVLTCDVDSISWKIFKNTDYLAP